LFFCAVTARIIKSYLPVAGKSRGLDQAKP